MTTAPLGTVSEVLARFETDFVDFADGFANGEYVLWLGSGISREKMPPVDVLVERVVELLRSNIDHDDASCRFKSALEQVLDLSTLTNDARADIDFGLPVAEWAVREQLVWSLVGNYSKVLGVPVAQESQDYLVWTGLNVPGTYGNSIIEPDVEHFCIGILMLEGVVDSAVTSNWDGLVEKAVAELATEAYVRVVVDAAEDLRKPPARSDLVKFHGCAVRAVADETKYRKMLIARAVQIDGWAADNRHMKNKLQGLLGERNTLVIGLSVQDGNMRTMFAESARDLARHWPAKPPALVLSEERLHANHREALELVYGDDYHPNASDIANGALLGAYGKPTLMALVLWTLTEKLAALAASLPAANLGSADIDRLKADLRAARTTLGGLIADQPRGFLAALIQTVTATLSMFRSGTPTADSGHTYVPLTVATIEQALSDPDFPAAQLGRFAVALSLLSRGHHSSDWEARPDAASGSFAVAAGSEKKRMFVVRDSREALTLERSEEFDPDDEHTVLISADCEMPSYTRSPGGAYGRTGRTGASRFSIEDICQDATSADDLYEAFKMAGGLG